MRDLELRNVVSVEVIGMVTLEATMVAMIFTLAFFSLLPRRQFPKDSSSRTLLQTMIHIWKTVFNQWSGEEHGDTTMEIGMKTMCSGRIHEHTKQSPKRNAALFHSQTKW